MQWFFHATAPVALRAKTGQSPDQQLKNIVDPEHDQTPAEEEQWIVCRQCQQRITRPSESVAINGAHRHTFANPSGIVFEIDCFQAARGCRFIGPPSSDFTWFAGHTWQVTVCAGCSVHLGWRFISQGGHRFYGLISDRITEASSAKA